MPSIEESSCNRCVRTNKLWNRFLPFHKCMVLQQKAAVQWRLFINRLEPPNVFSHAKIQVAWKKSIYVKHMCWSAILCFPKLLHFKLFEAMIAQHADFEIVPHRISIYFYRLEQNQPIFQGGRMQPSMPTCVLPPPSQILQNSSNVV